MKSSAWLALLQVTNILVPYIVIGTLTRQFSVEEFGYVMFCISISHFCFVLTDFGFYISGVDRIAKDSREAAIFKVFDHILNAKLILTTFTIFVLALCIQLDVLKIDKTTFMYLAILVVAQAFLPTFFYHGRQKLHVLVLFSVISKIIYALLVFSLVNSLTPNIVIFFLALTNAITTIMCFVNIKKIRTSNFKVNLLDGLQEIKASYSYFVSRLFAASYTSLGGLLVGLVSLQYLAVYSTAEYFLKGMQSITSPVTQAIFPVMAKTKNLKFFFLTVLIGVALLSVVASTTYIFRENVYSLVFGNLILLHDHILLSFIILGVVNFMSSIMGYPLFTSIQQTNIANYAIYCGGCVAISGFSILYMQDQLTGLNVVLVMLIAEVFVLFFRLISYYLVR